MHNSSYRNYLLILAFAVFGFGVMGYHPGSEDDAIYLTAVKAELNPALFPHDAAFFKLQMRTTVFDTWLAHFVLLTGLPVPWAELLGQSITILMVVWACWSIVRQLFQDAAAHWAGVAMVTAMFTLPVAGTALYIMDQHLHPRNMATALILFAVSRILAGKHWQALPLLGLAFVLHPIMGAMGISFCCFLILTLREPLRLRLGALRARLFPRGAAPVAAMVPFAWVFGPPSQPWLEALHSRHWFRLYEWEWYEWLGAIAPLLLFLLVAHIAAKNGEVKLARFATAIVIYGVFQQTIAMVILKPQALIGLSALEPMRYLHLVYVFMALIGGAYLGRYVLKARLWRWAIFLVVANGSMFVAQRQLFAASAHIELPSAAIVNPWLQAFDWIRHNTPEDAYFALDPRYMAAPGEDYHGFRALAERSQLADGIKDTSVVTKAPELGPAWKRQLEAQQGWSSFKFADFERLKADFGVDWVLVAYPPPAGLDCRWHNQILTACKIP